MIGHVLIQCTSKGLIDEGKSVDNHHENWGMDNQHEGGGEIGKTP